MTKFTTYDIERRWRLLGQNSPDLFLWQTLNLITYILLLPAWNIQKGAERVHTRDLSAFLVSFQRSLEQVTGEPQHHGQIILVHDVHGGLVTQCRPHLTQDCLADCFSCARTKFNCRVQLELHFSAGLGVILCQLCYNSRISGCRWVRPFLNK